MYGYSAVVVLVLMFIHLQRLMWAVERAQWAYTVREIAIGILGVTALAVFWEDVRQCRTHEGVLRLVALEGLALIILPCLWTVPPLCPVPPPEEEEGRP